MKSITRLVKGMFCCFLAVAMVLTTSVSNTFAIEENTNSIVENVEMNEGIVFEETETEDMVDENETSEEITSDLAEEDEQEESETDNPEEETDYGLIDENSDAESISDITDEFEIDVEETEDPDNLDIEEMEEDRENYDLEEGLGASNESDFEYKEYSDYIEITEYKYRGEESGDLVIPSSINGKPVKVIGDHAFSGCSKFSGKLVIPDSVISIENSAFWNCNGFTGNLIIPNSVTSIGGSAFYNCKGFTGNLVIPDSVTTIGSFAFECCSGFTGNLKISDNLTTIEQGVFMDCSGFTGTLFLPAKLTSIGHIAFEDCKNFSGDLVITNNVLTIEGSAFCNCSGFTGNLVIPDSVTTIGSNAFEGCRGFTGNLVIPNSVNSIGDGAFENCRGFTGSLKISDNVSEIGKNVFQNCYGLTGDLSIPDSVKSIGDSAFGGCKGFTGKLVIPNSVISIGNSAFGGCKKLTGNLVIPNSVISIGDYAFGGCEGFTGTLVIPNSVKTIESRAFEDCRGFTGNLVIPDSLLSLGAGAFGGCIGMGGKLTIPSTINTIKASTYRECGFTESLYIPSSVTIIEFNAFKNCSKIPKIFLPETISCIGYEAFFETTYEGTVETHILKSDFYCVKDSYAWNWVIENGGTPIEWDDFESKPLIDRTCKDITIHVVDKFGKAINKAQVKIDGHIESTNSNGDAKFSCANNKSYKVSVATTANGTKDTTINSGENNRFEIKMDSKYQLPNLTAPDLSNVKGNATLQAETSFAGKKVKYLNVEKFTIGFGKGEPYSVNVEFDDSTGIYKVTFGIKETEKDPKEEGNSKKNEYDAMKYIFSNVQGKTSAKKINKLLKKEGYEPLAQIGKYGVGMEASVMGFFSFTYDETGYHLIEDGALVKLEGKGSISYRPAFTLGIGYAKAALALSVTGKIYIKLNDSIYLYGKLQSETSFKVAGGVGVDQAHVEIGGSLGVDSSIALGNERKWNINKDLEMNASGKIYLEAKVLFFKGTLDKKVNLQLWPLDDGGGARGGGSGGGVRSASPQSLTDSIPSLGNTYDISDLEMMGRDYLSYRAGEISSLKAVPGEGEYVYPDGSPQIAKLSDGKLIAVWVADLGTKSDANRTSIVYSVYNGSSWSEAEIVYEDGKNAFYPVMASDGNDAYVAWVTFDRTFDDSVTAEEMASSTEIVVSRYHDGSFGEPIIVTENSNGLTEEMPQIAVSDNEVSVVWVENSVNDPYLIDGNNTIKCCTLNRALGDKSESIILDNLKSIYGMSAAYINDALHIAYLMDLDGNSEDTSDIELYDYSYGRSVQITSDNIAQSNPVFAGGDLYWSEENGLSRAVDADPFNVVSYDDLAIENYDIVGGNQSPILVFPVSDGFKSELFVGNIGSTDISDIHPITEYNNQVSYYALEADSTGSLAGIVFEKLINDDTSEEIYGNTRLHLCTGFSAQDLQVKDMSMYTGDLKEDGSILIVASVYNGSSEAVENVSVSILINGEEKKTETVECHLEPGETGSVEIDYDGGIAAAGNELSIKVNPTSFTDSHTDNNTASAVVEFNDLKISNYNADSSEKTITATLKNDGQSAMSNVVANIYEGGKEGEIVYSQSYGNMAAGAEDTLTYSIPSDKLTFTNAEEPKIFYLELVSDDEESNYGNNSSIISVFPVRVTGISLDKSELTMAAKSTDTLSVTVLPENAYDKSVIYLSSDNKVVMVADDGTLVATGEGEATIMAVSSDGGFTSECVVTVEEAQSELSISEQAIEVNAGETFELTVKEASTEEEKELPVEITWSSSDETVATVDSDGVVTGVAKGTALIYASNGEDFHDSCMVYVLEDTETLYLSDSLLYLTEGDEYTLEATVLEDEYDETSVTWSSSDEQVVSVSDSGTVIALSAGQATVTATTDKGTSVECTVSVSEAVTYTVTFDDSIGGFDYVDGIPEGGCISPIAPPSRTGYDFLGWYTEKDGQGEAFTSSYAVNDNLTVYAYWKRNEDFGNSGDVLPGDIPSGGIPSDLWIAGIKESGVVYEGTAIKPEVRVYDGKHLLKANIDYTISYKNNTNAYTPLNDKDTKAPTITVTGKGNYAGKESAVFTIVPRDIADEGVDVTPVATVISNGKVQKPVPVLTFNKKKLSNNKDFKIVSYKNESGDTVSECKEPGKYFIEIEGIKNFEGIREIPFEISGKERTLISKVTLSKIASVEYTGFEIIPEIKLTNSKKVPLVESTDGETGDYVVTYADDHKEIGTHTVTITGINDYCGTRTATFSITGRKISAAKIDGVPKTETFTGNPIKPAISLTYTTGKGATAVTDSLLEDTDYTVEYTNNTNPGTATITITGIGHYTGTVKKTFKIVNKAISNEDSALSISFDEKDIVMGSGSADVPSIAYTKGGAKPGITVTFTYVDSDGETVNEKLTEKTDYTVKYSNNTAITTDATAKLPTITVTGKGRFKGSKTRTFKIVPQDLSAEDTGIIMSAPDKVASSKKGAWVSTPVITDKDGKKLAAGKDYDKNLSYVVLNPDGTDGEDVTATAKQITLSAGTYVKVTARAIETTNPAKPSCYTGSISTTYRIVGTDISKANISVKAKTYTGKAIKLDKSDITVKVGKQILPDDSYEIVESTYTNNVNKGKATVVIKGAGDCDGEYYGGEKIVTFTIGSKSFLWWWRNLMQ